MSISPQGYIYGKDPKSNNPFWTDGDINDNLTATATVDNTTGTPTVEVSKNGYNLNFAFHNLKGEKGDTGATGETGATGAQGIQGPQGEKGDTGAPGATGTTPDITATATVDNTTGTPAVTVTKSGTADAPTLAFAFSGIKGEKGDTGDAPTVESHIVTFTNIAISNIVGTGALDPLIHINDNLTVVLQNCPVTKLIFGDALDNLIFKEPGTVSGSLLLYSSKVLSEASTGKFCLESACVSSGIDRIDNNSTVRVYVKIDNGNYLIRGISMLAPYNNYNSFVMLRVNAPSVTTSYLSKDGTSIVTDDTTVSGIKIIN